MNTHIIQTNDTEISTPSIEQLFLFPVNNNNNNTYEEYKICE